MSKKTASLLLGAYGLLFILAAALTFLFVTGRTMHKLVGVPLILGVSMVGASAATSFEEFKARTTGRGTFFTTFSIVAALVVVVGLAALNYVVVKKGWTHDFTKNKVFTLADQTTSLLKNLKTEVHVTAAFGGADKQYPEVEDLLSRYKNVAGDKLVVDYFDPIKDPVRTKKLNITASAPRIIVTSGPEGAQKESRVKEPTEEALTNAIAEVTRGTQKKIYFTTGHGEKSIKDDKENGFKKFVEGIKSEGFQVEELSLLAHKELPADAQVLVIAGPVAPFLPQEIATLKAWTEKSGRLFLMLDPDTQSGLEATAREWGVDVKDATILDPQSQIPTYALGMAAAEHPITAPRRSIFALQSVWPLARPVHKLAGAPAGWSVTELIKTTDAAWGKSGPLPAEGEVKADPAKDDLGPVPVAVVATKGSGDSEIRVAVFGDSDFATNQDLRLAPGNYDIALNTIDWLAHEEAKISIRPKTRDSSHLFLSQDQAMAMQFSTLIVMPLGLLGFGLAIWLTRRDK